MPPRGTAPTCSTGPMPRATSSRPSTADELRLSPAASSARGGSLVLPPRPGWRELARRYWHAQPPAASTPPTNPAPESGPAGRRAALLRAKRASWSGLGLSLEDGLAAEVGDGRVHGLLADLAAGLSGLQFAGGEVETAVQARQPGLVGGCGERLPGQGHQRRRR